MHIIILVYLMLSRIVELVILQAIHALFVQPIIYCHLIEHNAFMVVVQKEHAFHVLINAFILKYQIVFGVVLLPRFAKNVMIIII